MKYMNADYTGSKKILEINTRHPLIKNLSRMNMGDSKDPRMEVIASRVPELAQTATELLQRLG